MGFYFAYLCEKQHIFTNIQVGLLMSLSVAGYGVLYFCFHFLGTRMWTDGLYWYPFFLITPGMVLFISWVMDHLTILDNLLNRIGRISFEFYLFNELFVNASEKYLSLSLDDYGILKSIIVFLATVLVAWCYQKTIQAIINMLKKKE